MVTDKQTGSGKRQTWNTGHPWGGSKPTSPPHCGGVMTLPTRNFCVLENYLFSVFLFFSLAHGIRTPPFFSTLQKYQYGYPGYAATCADLAILMTNRSFGDHREFLSDLRGSTCSPVFHKTFDSTIPLSATLL